MGHSSRYELKYVLEEPRAVAVANYVARYLRPSEHNGSGPIRGHPVISLYLDSPDLFFFHQGFAGVKNRIKLRIRFYDDKWERPAFIEVKRRVSDVIIKGRAKMSREGVRKMLCHGWPFMPDYSALVHARRRQAVLDHFIHYANMARARGVLYVSYFREIYECPEDEELRVTFDRQIRGSLYDGTGRLSIPRRGVPPRLPYFPPNGVVLELKFEERAPRWMHEMVQEFNLDRRAVCKYCACVDGMGLQWGAPWLPEREEQLAM